MLKSGVGSSVLCAGCHKSFKRHATHIALNSACAEHYTDNLHNETAAIQNSFRNSSSGISNRTKATKKSPLLSSGINQNPSVSTSCKRSPATLPDKSDDAEDTDDVAFHSFDQPSYIDDLCVEIHEDNIHSDKTMATDEEDDQPDESVLKLYEELFQLRSNPFGLERFSKEEKSISSFFSFSRN